MCEIAVFDPERTGIEIAQQLAYTFYEEQGDGLGVLAIHDNGDSYEYETYKSTNPHWQTLYSFFNREWDDAWRFVVHGRNGTSGGVNRSAAHPIDVNCDACDFDHVIHNGSVRNWRQQRASLISHGHQFTGSVDTEVIPHKVSEIPESTDDLSYNTYNMTGNLNYLLFSEDGILARVTRKYDLTDDFRMTCRYSDVSDHGFASGRNRWLIARPGEDIDSKEKNYTSSRTSTSSNYQHTRGHGSAVQQGARRWRSDLEDEGNESGHDTDQQETRGTESGGVTINYTDLAENYDEVSILKVAPGVLKIIDYADDETSFIKRATNPRLYYFYAPEDFPQDVSMEDLEAAAEKHSDPVKGILKNAGTDTWAETSIPTNDDTQQQSLDDVDEADEVAAEESARAAASVVAEAAPEGTEIRDHQNADVSEALKQLF